MPQNAIDRGRGMIDHNVTVVLSGGGPWGFSLTGGQDFNQELAVSNIEPGGPADSSSGLRIGDVIRSVNRVPVRLRTEALEHIRNASSRLEVCVFRPGLRSSTSMGSLDAWPPTGPGLRSEPFDSHRHSTNELNIQPPHAAQLAPPPVPPRPPSAKTSLASPVHSAAVRWQAARQFASSLPPSSHDPHGSSTSLSGSSTSLHSPSPSSSAQRPRVETFTAPEIRSSSSTGSISSIGGGSSGALFGGEYPRDPSEPPHPLLARPYLQMGRTEPLSTESPPRWRSSATIHLHSATASSYSPSSAGGSGGSGGGGQSGEEPVSRPMSWHADDWENGGANHRTGGGLFQRHAAPSVASASGAQRSRTSRAAEAMRAKMASLPSANAAFSGTHHRPRRSTPTSAAAAAATRSRTMTAPPPDRVRRLSDIHRPSDRERRVSDIVRPSGQPPTSPSLPPSSAFPFPPSAGLRPARPSLLAEIEAEQQRHAGADLAPGLVRRGIRRFESEGPCQLGRSDSDASTLVPADARTISPCETPPLLESPPSPGDVFGARGGAGGVAPVGEGPPGAIYSHLIDVESGREAREVCERTEASPAFSGRRTPDGLRPITGLLIDVEPSVTSRSSPAPAKAPVSAPGSAPAPALPPRRFAGPPPPPPPHATPAATSPLPSRPSAPVRQPSLDGESTIPRNEYARLLRSKQEMIVQRSSIRGANRPLISSPVPSPSNSLERVPHEGSVTPTASPSPEAPKLPPRTRRTVRPLPPTPPPPPPPHANSAPSPVSPAPPSDVSNPIYDGLPGLVSHQRLPSNASSHSGCTTGSGGSGGSGSDSRTPSRPSSLSDSLTRFGSPPTGATPPPYLPNSYIHSRRLPRQGYGGDYRSPCSPHSPNSPLLPASGPPSGSTPSPSPAPPVGAAAVLAAKRLTEAELGPRRGPRSPHKISDLSQAGSAGSEHVRTPSKDSCESASLSGVMFVPPPEEKNDEEEREEREEAVASEEEEEEAAEEQEEEAKEEEAEIFEEAPSPPGAASSGRGSACSGATAAAAVGEALRQELADLCGAALHTGQEERVAAQMLSERAEMIAERLPDRKLSLALVPPPESRLESHLRALVRDPSREELEEEEEEAEETPKRPERNGGRSSFILGADAARLKIELLRCFEERVQMKRQGQTELQDRRTKNAELGSRIRERMEEKCKPQLKRLDRLGVDVDCLFKLMCQLTLRLVAAEDQMARLKARGGATAAELERVSTLRAKLQEQSAEARQIRAKLDVRQADLVDSTEEFFSEEEQLELADYIRGLWTISLHQHLIESNIRADEAKVTLLRESLDLGDAGE